MSTANTPAIRLRRLAACLVGATGCLLIATLWLQPLSETVLLKALLGAVYLILCLGLFGRSRFSLVLGIVLPGSAALYLTGFAEPAAVTLVRIAADAIAAVCCAVVLWRQQGINTS